MANATVLGNFESLLPYFPAGARGIMHAARRWLPQDVIRADSLALYSVAGISTTKAEIDDDAGARPIAIIAQSTGTKCYIHLHNADADNVTEGVNVDFLVPVSSTSGEITALFCLGDSWTRFWDTGLTISASTTTETSSAPANTPNVWMILHGG